jgi:DNA replication protein DnaC
MTTSPLTFLPAGPCKACGEPLPARRLTVGAAFCAECRAVKTQAVIDAGKAIDHEQVEAVEREVARQTAEYMDRAKAHPAKCPRCGAALPGTWGVAYCTECRLTIAAESTSEAVAAREEERKILGIERRAMTIDQARRAWANLPPDVGRGFNLAARLEVSGIQEAIVATQTWMGGASPPWLVLNGSEGVGKSHLAEVAARSLAIQGKRVRWEDTGELLDRLRAMHGQDEENAFSHMAQVADTPWLVLDDFGKTKPTEWVAERLHMLINSRAVRQARTMITTNENMKSLEARTSHYIAARVFDTGSGMVAVVTMDGPSYRTSR